MANVNHNMTVLKYLFRHAAEKPDDAFLVDRKEGEVTVYSFKQAHEIAQATARSLTSLFPGAGNSGDGGN